MRKSLGILLLIIIIGFTSCEKPSMEVCGEVTGGRTEFNNVSQRWMFYLNIDGRPIRVDQKTYESYFVGDFICLE